MNKKLIFLAICAILGLLIGCSNWSSPSEPMHTELCKKQLLYDQYGRVVGFYYIKEFYCKVPGE